MTAAIPGLTDEQTLRASVRRLKNRYGHGSGSRGTACGLVAI
jgi:hypothetical protein